MYGYDSFGRSNNYQVYLREFWNAERLARKAEADRVILLDANLTKKTEECDALTARIASLKRALVSVNVRLEVRSSAIQH